MAPPEASSVPVLALTQGDPAGIGPEILLRLLVDTPAQAESASWPWQPVLVAERAALEAVRDSLPEGRPETLSSDGLPQDFWGRLRYLTSLPEGPLDPQDDSVETVLAEARRQGHILVLDPVASRRQVVLGTSSAADAAGALAALDAAVDLVRRGWAQALVTAPVSKESIARQHLPDFRGHTEYLAAGCGLERYGRDYLMAFLAPGLRVALLSTHLPLRQALDHVRQETVVEALTCLGRHVSGRIALAGLNPHAGESGLLGREDDTELVPAVAAARAAGLNVSGPWSADSLFARARQGDFDWVLALYHDQGLIAVKTAAFGQATNWTLGLPYLRTSVDHGTAFEIAGRGLADARPLRAVVETTLALLGGRQP